MRRVADAYHWAAYRTHVGKAEKCGCGLDGPDRNCDLGWALYAVAVKKEAA